MPLAQTIKCHLVRNKSLACIATVAFMIEKYRKQILEKENVISKKNVTNCQNLCQDFITYSCFSFEVFTDIFLSRPYISCTLLLSALFCTHWYLTENILGRISRTHFVKENKGCFDSHPFCLRNCSFPGKWKGCHAFMKVFLSLLSFLSSQNISFLFQAVFFPPVGFEFMTLAEIQLDMS